MELLEHLLYQELLEGRCSLADAVRTIERVLVDQGVVDPERVCAEADRVAGEVRATDRLGVPAAASRPEVGRPSLTGCSDSALTERVYGAILIKTLFERFPLAQIWDIINLAHKEAVAREVWLRLHDEPVHLQRVEELLREFAALPLGESQVSPSITIGIRVQLISTLISDNLFYIGVAKNHITMRDVAALMDRFVGKYGQRSRIGGKSAGMILANRILRPLFGEPTGLEERIAEVESYFLTAQVFNRFIEHNRLQEGHSLKYMAPEERERTRVDLERRFHRGVFPPEVRDALAETLTKLGEGPLIVRSSSLLEDSMGFPFYGKYESIFIPNHGSPEERLERLIDAVKQVYVSILANSVIEYRKDKALLDYDDMMCILVQRVVGERHGRWYLPAASGVAFSRNQYCWTRKINPKAGVARLVFGLGTRAVDRSGDDYPRLVALSHPDLRPEATQREKLRYSQRFVDALNLESGSIESVHFVDLINEARLEDPAWEPAEAVSLVADDRLEPPRLFPERLEYGAAAITFDRLLADTGPRESVGATGPRGLAGLLREVLARLEAAYGVPVDIEFAWQGGKLYVLQCRPLAQGSKAGEAVDLPAVAPEQHVLFETRRDIFASAVRRDIRYVVHVDGERYHALGESDRKLEVGRLIGRLNRALEGERFMLVGPGRWGTSNLELGVRVTYGEINHATVLAEVGSNRTGYTPEVSYGTHFFQDLVEADIVPLALFPDEEDERFDVGFLAAAPDALPRLLPDEEIDPEIAACVGVTDLDEAGAGRLSLFLSADEGRGVGLLG